MRVGYSRETQATLMEMVEINKTYTHIHTHTHTHTPNTEKVSTGKG